MKLKQPPQTLLILIKNVEVQWASITIRNESHNIVVEFFKNVS